MSKTLIDLDYAGSLNVTSGLAFQPGGKVIRNRTTRPSMLRRRPGQAPGPRRAPIPDPC